MCHSAFPKTEYMWLSLYTIRPQGGDTLARKCWFTSLKKKNDGFQGDENIKIIYAFARRL